jgi:hypothetical protein
LFFFSKAITYYGAPTLQGYFTIALSLLLSSLLFLFLLLCLIHSTLTPRAGTLKNFQTWTLQEGSRLCSSFFSSEPNLWCHHIHMPIKTNRILIITATKKQSSDIFTMGNQHSTTTPSEEQVITNDSIDKEARAIVSELDGEDAWYLTGAGSSELSTPGWGMSSSEEEDEEEIDDEGEYNNIFIRRKVHLILQPSLANDNVRLSNRSL